MLELVAIGIGVLLIGSLFWEEIKKWLESAVNVLVNAVAHIIYGLAKCVAYLYKYKDVIYRFARIYLKDSSNNPYTKDTELQPVPPENIPEHILNQLGEGKVVETASTDVRV